MSRTASIKRAGELRSPPKIVSDVSDVSVFQCVEVDSILCSGRTRPVFTILGFIILHLATGIHPNSVEVGSTSPV